MTLYHLANSRSQRIVWLLEELKLNYNLVFADVAIPDELPNSVLALKFPTLSITTHQGEYVLTETTAVAEFLLSEFGQHLIINSEQTSEFLDYLFWKNFSDGSLMVNVILKQTFSQITKSTPLIFRPISWSFQYGFNKAYLEQAIDQQLKRVDYHLRDHDWLAGATFSLADILLWFPLEACMRFTPNTSHQNLNRYMQQIHECPSFCRALEKGKWSNDEFDRYWSI